MQNKYTFKFIHTNIHFYVDQDTDDLFQFYIKFFKTHFDIFEGLIGQPDVEISVHHFSTFNLSKKFADLNFQPIKIRESSAPSFNLYGKKAVVRGNEIVISEHTGIAIFLNKIENKINLWLSNSSQIQAVEFIRDYIIKNEESHGSIILHASAAVIDGQAIVMVGPKGAGKSTMLLYLVSEMGHDFLSGDKVFLVPNDTGDIVVYGWPEFPHLGFGTISNYPKLMEALMDQGIHIDVSKPNQKIITTTELLSQSLGYRIIKGGVPLKHVVFPNVSDMKNEIFITESNEHKIIENMEFTCDYPVLKWHSFIKSPIKSKMTEKVNELIPILKKLSYYESFGIKPFEGRKLNKKYEENSNIWFER